MILKRSVALELLLLLFVSLSLVSCSKELSRSRAKDQIVSHLGLPQVEAVSLIRVYVKSYRSSGGGLLPRVCLVTGERYSDAKGKLDGLEAQGLITVSERGPRGVCNVVSAVVTLTDMGKQYLVSEAEDEYRVKTCDIAFGEVTGIQLHEQFGVAEVNYTLWRENCTPFAGTGAEQAITRSAFFARFDDGWRIDG